MVYVTKRRKKKPFWQLAIWQLLLLWLLWTIVTGTLWRLNNIGMKERRDAVITADRDGDKALLESSLSDLQTYVSRHMNTSVEEVNLVGAYEREAKAQLEAARERAAHNPHGNIHKKAAEVCDPNYTLYSTPYFNCFMAELSRYEGSDEISLDIKLPPKELYRLSFAAPALSWDWAGLATVVWLILGLIIAVRILAKLFWRVALLLKSKKS